MKERITAVLEHWFISEPALFQVLCTHEFIPNESMLCPVRSGRRRVEYNPVFLQDMSDSGLEEALRAEAIRILLKHPYERKPDGCCQKAIAIGSDIVIGDNYSYDSFCIDKPQDYELPEGMAYEWYSRKIQERLPESGGEGLIPDRQTLTSKQDLSELWDEDDIMVCEINGIINACESWGSLSGDLVEKLQASTKAKINWRNVFSGFRASILSSRRRLTRMKPNRRSGFLNMGSTREFDTKLLVAIDVSGSISSESLSYFFGVVNSAFRYGFKSIDVVQFDCGVRSVQTLKKVTKEVYAVGRGGTSFQEPIDYACDNGYEGLLILTDGYAPPPTIPAGMRCKIIWVCQNRRSYESSHEWMEKSGRVCTIELS